MNKFAYHAFREVAFLKNRTSLYIVTGLFILAAIGIASSFIDNPSGFLQKIAVMLLVIAVIFLIVRRFSKAHPEKQEQRAYLKAAKQSKKRYQKREDHDHSRRPASGSISSIKKIKKHPSHLTVIEGKKGKKKNRATF